MPNIRYIILSIAILATVGLYFLPRVVVENEPAQTASVSDVSGGGEEVTDMHSTDIPEEQAAHMNEHKALFREATSEAQKLEQLTELMDEFKSFNLYDSAAIYAGQFANEYPSLANSILAGDAYFDAFSFAMSKEKTDKLGVKVREYYQRALEIEPNEDLEVKIGVTYVSGDNPMQGILKIREVLGKNPENKLAIYNLGMLSMQSGQFDRAVERFEKLIELEPENTQAHFYLGVSYLETGSEQKALERFEHVKAVETNPQVLQSVEAYIKEIK
ncbi:tetratricopeptide repeat protein [Flammeovirgaceae bacterium SG7u.111]|nr:tetratricopeptide repeat protein [Flammeovirgaceae bacterium SG7u.132]WPO35425.1 tetratricopeptide repeat protein [Flammeovirgaceae bacterium SG7u.111]